MKATEISAQEHEVILGGRAIRLRFDHNQMRQSELYWQWSIGRRLGYLGIVAQLTARTYIGLEAIAYGAAASFALANGHMPMAMREFDRMVTYDELRAAGDVLIDGAMSCFPKAAKKADAPAAE